jgi:PAS domain-containing protein
VITTTLDADGLSRAVIDAIPSPLFIVDEDVRILAYNDAAGALLGQGAAPLRTRAGEALHCINSTAVAEGCGGGEACKTCVVRSSVGESIRNHKVVRRAQRMVLLGRNG